MMKPYFLLGIFFYTTPTLRAAITWNLNFNDVTQNSGVGFDDPVSGQERRNTLGAVTDYISSQVQGLGNVEYTFRRSETDGTGSLASAGTLFFDSPNRFANGLLFDHATTGFDPATSSDDGSAVFDFGYNWNNGLNVTTSAQFDLFTVALHELTHAMGYISLITGDGTSLISGGNPGVYGIYDTFIQRRDGTRIMSNTMGASFVGTASDLRNGDLFFGGSNAIAANGNEPVKLFAPPNFAEGDSLSHIDSSINSIMNTGLARGESKRTYTNLDLAVLQDIGWQIVPEHSVLTLVGGAGLLLIVRRR